MKKLKKQRSVVPVYLIAVVWFIAGFFVRIHRPLQFAVTIAISAAVFLLGRMVWRDRTIVINTKDPEPKQEEKQPETRQAEQPRPSRPRSRAAPGARGPGDCRPAAGARPGRGGDAPAQRQHRGSGALGAD